MAGAWDAFPVVTTAPTASGWDSFPVTPSDAPPPTPQTSQSLGFYEGFMHPFDRAALALQGAANAIGIAKPLNALGAKLGMAPSAEAAQQQHEQYVAGQERAGVVPGKIGEFAGNVAGTLPLARLGPVAGGAATGALLGNSDTPSGTVADMLSGAVGGKVGSAVVSTIGGFIAPKLAPAIQMLKDIGVQLTPGQIMGGFGKKLEDAATSIPFIGDAIQAAQRRSVMSFNRGVVDQALKPIGESLPQNVAPGHDAVAYAGDRLSAAYDRLLPSLKVAPDNQFVNDINAARTSKLSSVPPAIQEQFDKAMSQDVAARFSAGTAGPSLDGQALKDMESRLGSLARSYSGALDPDQRALGHAFGDVRDGLRDLVGRSNPSAAAELAKINQGYAQLVRIEGAAAKAGPLPGGGEAGGIFTPQQLLIATRQADQSVRNRASARGSALMQDIAEAGKSVLPSSVPDSGTARRMLASGAVLGTGAGLLHLLDPMTLGAVLGSAAGYSKLGTRALQTLLTERPSFAPAIAAALVKVGRPAAITAGAAAAPALISSPATSQETPQ
jgi:hypothetical protein